jgi:pSer/pThr/pTyr-binding forkhead associated (FHA) protein
MTIGRAAGCNIVIDDHFVSSVHTRIFQRDDTWMIEDLGSTNGTYLNRRKVTGPSVIHKGDQVQVGNVVLEVR